MRTSGSFDDTAHTPPKPSRSTESSTTGRTDEPGPTSLSTSNKRHSRPKLHIENIHCKRKLDESTSNADHAYRATQIYYFSSSTPPDTSFFCCINDSPWWHWQDTKTSSRRGGPLYRRRLTIIESVIIIHRRWRKPIQQEPDPKLYQRKIDLRRKLSHGKRLPSQLDFHSFWLIFKAFIYQRRQIRGESQCPLIIAVWSKVFRVI